jgi:hypothetical protein
MLEIVTVPGGASWSGEPAMLVMSVPATLSGSTVVRDQMIPADGSMNQLFSNA